MLNDHNLDARKKRGEATHTHGFLSCYDILKAFYLKVVYHVRVILWAKYFYGAPGSLWRASPKMEALNFCDLSRFCK